MLMVAQIDGTTWKLAIGDLVEDKYISVELFWNSINTQFKQSLENVISIVTDVRDIHLRSKINTDKLIDSKQTDNWR